MTVQTKSNESASTFGDFVAAAYRAWGSRRAKGLVLLALNLHLAAFRGRQRL
jgi:hypothetical protein